MYGSNHMAHTSLPLLAVGTISLTIRICRATLKNQGDWRTAVLGLHNELEPGLVQALQSDLGRIR